MPTPAIIERVRELHAELGETQPNPATQADLEALTRQLETVLVEPTSVPHYAGLRDKLLFAYVGFEVHHPKLAGLVQGVATQLAAAGL